MLTFLGIGAQKAGTTWLYAMLRQHPEVSFPGNKEMHFWDKQFPHAHVANYFNFFNHPSLQEGEITPSYAQLSLTTIKAIHQGAPQLRLIYILRNPMERAWSAALMGLQRAQMEPEEASDCWFIDHFYSSASMRRGDYEQCISNWLSIFPAGHLLILEYETIHQNPTQLLQNCCQHIGISPFTQNQLLDMNIEKKIFESNQHPIRPSLKPTLLTLYTEKVQSLSVYLKRDLTHWLHI